MPRISADFCSSTMRSSTIEAASCAGSSGFTPPGPSPHAPSVHVTSTVRIPSAAAFARTPPVVVASSSGCACTAIKVSGFPPTPKTLGRGGDTGRCSGARDSDLVGERLSPDLPSAVMDQPVVEPAQVHAVGLARHTPVEPVGEVVDPAAPQWHLTTGPAAAAVLDLQRLTNGLRPDPAGAPDVEHLGVAVHHDGKDLGVAGEPTYGLGRHSFAVDGRGAVRVVDHVGVELAGQRFVAGDDVDVGAVAVV